MKIEALLFDLGKVLVNFNFDLGLQRLAARSELPAEQLRSIVLDADWIGPYERGEISTTEYHKYICETARVEMELEDFHETWSAIFLPDLIVPEHLLASLKEQYPLVLVSNTNESHVAFIAKNYPVFRYF